RRLLPAPVPAAPRPPPLRERREDLQALRGRGPGPDSRGDRLSPPAPHRRPADGHGGARHRGGPAPPGARQPGDDPGLLRGYRPASAERRPPPPVRGTGPKDRSSCPSRLPLPLPGSQTPTSETADCQRPTGVIVDGDPEV